MDDAWQEGLDGTRRSYAERLLPPWWVWLLGAVMTGSLGVAYGGAYGAAAGWAVFVPAQLALTAALALTSPVVAVDDRVLRAGRARLPLRHVGRVRALDAEQSAAARTRDLDPAAHLLLRPWAARGSVAVQVADPRDPHPYWLVSSRSPARLAAALRAAADGSAGLPPAPGTGPGPAVAG